MIRRVVTGHRGGKAVFVSDGTPPRSHAFEKIPGMASSFAWAAPANPRIGDDTEGESVFGETNFLPQHGQTRLTFLRIPPDSWVLRDDADVPGGLAEFAEHQPEMAAIREAADPGMHRTDTVDYVIVLDGEVYLELDDQQEVFLRQHDVVIQNGTRHAWRNRGDRPATLGVVLIGARRDDDSHCPH